MYALGDYVVPLPIKEEWKNQYPSYVPEMYKRVGNIGHLIPIDLPDRPRTVRIAFGDDGHDSWYYDLEWIRLATEEEIRGHKFARDVERI